MPTCSFACLKYSSFSVAGSSFHFRAAILFFSALDLIDFPSKINIHTTYLAGYVSVAGYV